MKKNDTKYQLVPPHRHRANAAECSIQTFKNHFKAGIASLDPDFPLNEWDRLLEQCFDTLNMLRASRTNPKISAYIALEGIFDFNKTPLAPPGTRVVVHAKPDNRSSWDPNGFDAWYIGPSKEHYRCVKVYNPKSRKETNADTVLFFPKHIPLPEITPDSFIRQAALDIITILSQPPKSNFPTVQLGNKERNAILQIATILQRDKVTPSISPSTEQDDNSPHVANNTSSITLQEALA